MLTKQPSPLIISKNGKVKSLERLIKTHKEFDEKYLQELLVQHPELLPINQLRDDAGSLLCIGREVPVGKSGAIDNLYLSSGGYPVIVETKLWRNPQARREVLSQILDYLKELVAKDFEWIQKQWSIFSKNIVNKTERNLFYQLSEISDDEIDEQYFIDRINRSLERGDILALIVGDGIESRLQQLVNHLCRDSAHLRYSLALIELACYHTDKEINQGELLIIPRVVREINPVERAYVRIEVAEDLKKEIKIKSDVKEETKKIKSGYIRRQLTEDDFLRQMEEAAGPEIRETVELFYHELVDELELEIDVKTATLSLKVPDPLGEEPSVNILGIDYRGKMYNTRHIKKQLHNWGLSRDDAAVIYGSYWKELNRIDKRFDEAGIGHMSNTKFVPIKSLIDKLDTIKDVIRKVVVEIRQIRDIQ